MAFFRRIRASFSRVHRHEPAAFALRAADPGSCFGGTVPSADQNFVHLHVHSDYSLWTEPAGSTASWTCAVALVGMPALALTADHEPLRRHRLLQHCQIRRHQASCRVRALPWLSSSRLEKHGRSDDEGKSIFHLGLPGEEPHRLPESPQTGLRRPPQRLLTISREPTSRPSGEIRQRPDWLHGSPSLRSSPSTSSTTARRRPARPAPASSISLAGRTISFGNPGPRHPRAAQDHSAIRN